MTIMNNFIKKHSDLITLAIIPIISGLPHAFNMLNYPYYENDEGVYMSQAWSIITQGRMAPYTYWYDHAPGGWIFIALWTLITGGFFTFGFSINSGRVLMFLLHIFSALFIYAITIKLTKDKLSGLLAVLIFSISPLAIYFQRRVLLDNIMTFFVLFSVVCIMYNQGKLRNIILSGILFGFSVLSKENSIFFIPFFIYCLYLYTNKKQRHFAIASWLSVMLTFIALYFLYALIKGELFPSGTFLGGNNPHVSLLGTLKDQLSRDGGGIIDINKSSFWVSIKSWLELDPMIIILGAIATIINLWISLSSIASLPAGRQGARVAERLHNPLLFAGLFSTSFWFFLIRGGLVIEFYSLPLFPILALNIAVSCWYFGTLLKNKFSISAVKIIPTLMLGIFFIGTSAYFSTNVRNIQNLYTSDQTTPQIQAIDWMLTRANPDAFYVIDNYGYIELHADGIGKFKNAEWYWKVDRDPEISRDILNGGPAGIDYVALTPQMEHDITTAGLDITKAAWNNSRPIARFWNDGWGVQFFATRFESRILKTSWNFYKNHFIKNGQTMDPYGNNGTTSEGQSYALLRAVWMNDHKAFDEIWSFTQKNLQQSDGLFVWRYSAQQTIDTGTASDADSDIALALLFASKQWNDDRYLQQALRVMNGIWNHEVVTLNNLPYLTAANWANHESTITINPSYLSPASYRIFAMADQSRPWNLLADTSYWLLKKCTAAPLDTQIGLLPPEWCAIDKQTFEAVQPGESQPRATEYSYNAFRIPWRIALDYAWFKAPDAKSFLSTLSFFSREYSNKGKISTAYTHDGKVWEAYESAAAYSGNLGYFIISQPAAAKKMYAEKIAEKYYEDEEKSYWEDPNNYYTQNWAWFGTALYTNHLKNLWSG